MNTLMRIKQVDGADKVNRNPKVNIEDYESIVNSMKARATTMKGYITEILKEFNDDTDPFKLRMPALFKKAEDSVNKLVTLRDETKEKYKSLLKFLAMEPTVQADKFCAMWDNFLVPESRLLKFDKSMQTKFII